MQVEALSTVGAVLGVLGIGAFDYFTFKNSWRGYFISIGFMSIIFSTLQLLLSYGATRGLPSVLFATGNESLATTVQ